MVSARPADPFLHRPSVVALGDSILGRSRAESELRDRGDPARRGGRDGCWIRTSGTRNSGWRANGRDRGPGRGEETLERRLDAGHPSADRLGAGRGSGLGGRRHRGLGGDAAIAAASTTRRVVVCERHPVVAALLVDGRDRAIRAGLEPADRIDVHRGDSQAYLEHAEVPPALVVIDPMFPPRRRASALPPKPMQRLRALLEGEERTVSAEVECLLAAADRAGASRIVLKRPPDSSTPGSPLGPPTFEISTKLLRWSVWERGGTSSDRAAPATHDGGDT